MAKFFVLASSLLLFTCGFADDPLTPKEIQLSTQPEKKVQRKSPTVKAAFSPFTGKVSGDKVRMRLQPDLDAFIVREVGKNEMLSIVDQEGEYYCVEPPEVIKAYIFRSFILDGVVEGNRVNVRLEPDLEAPVVGHLNSGDRINGQISSKNRKWLEIAPPTNTRFYVAKEFIEYAGGPELKGKIAERKETAEQLSEAATLFAKSEMEKVFEEIDFEKIKQGFLTIIHDYTDFPKKAENAKEALTDAQEQYLQKRIAYLEEKAALANQYAPIQEPNAALSLTLQTQTWSSIEEGLYASWTQSHDQKNIEEFYEEQKLVATSVSGVLEVFTSPVRNKPGDFILKNKNLPAAYIYSTKIDLQDYVGKQVTLIGSPRENNSFAFPAYFIHEIE
ncbi:MAG: hypothetical protein K1000chlam3_00828 [Chlamydiae bacterium]|nr:hypothetical protein [Chlamydiota bacterium]